MVPRHTTCGLAIDVVRSPRGKVHCSPGVDIVVDRKDVDNFYRTLSPPNKWKAVVPELTVGQSSSLATNRIILRAQINDQAMQNEMPVYSSQEYEREPLSLRRK